MIARCFVLLLVAAVAANAQTTPDLQIRIDAYAASPLGGEQRSVSRSTGPVTIGQTVSTSLSLGRTCDAWHVSADRSMRDGATLAWRVDVTPLQVVGGVVTFQLSSFRMAGATQPSKDRAPVSPDRFSRASFMHTGTEYRLAPGESLPLYSEDMPAGVLTADGRPCRNASIRVSVDRYPDAGEERRLIGAELWLVERLADGSEVQRSEPLALRGLPGHPFNFYFDSIVDGVASLDVHGSLIARRRESVIAISVETRSRWTPETRNISGPQRFLNWDVQMKPSETVDIRLPVMGNDAGPFAKRAFSIRIRARQIR